MTEQDRIVALVRSVLHPAESDVAPFREAAPEVPRLHPSFVQMLLTFAEEDRGLMSRSFVQYMKTPRWRVRMRRGLAEEIRYHAAQAQRHTLLAMGRS